MTMSGLMLKRNKRKLDQSWLKLQGRNLVVKHQVGILLLDQLLKLYKKDLVTQVKIKNKSLRLLTMHLLLQIMILVFHVSKVNLSSKHTLIYVQMQCLKLELKLSLLKHNLQLK